MDVDIKNEFEKLHARLDQFAATFVTKVEFEKFAAQVVTKVEFDTFKEDLFERMATKQQYSDHMILMDKAVREAKNAREDQLLQSNRFVDLDDQVQGHEKRIKKLEKVVA